MGSCAGLPVEKTKTDKNNLLTNTATIIALRNYFVKQGGGRARSKGQRAKEKIKFKRKTKNHAKRWGHK